MPLHKSLHEMWKTSWWKNNRLFRCVRVRDFEPKILIKGLHLTNSKKPAENVLKNKHLWIPEK